MKDSRDHGALLLAVIGWLLYACGRSAQDAPSEAIEETVSTPILEAIAHPERMAGDGDEDTWRQPQAVLEFMGVDSGMDVLDYFAGAGYFSELLSRAVGPSGSVLVYNNPPYAQFAGEKLVRRFEHQRLANAKIVTVPTQALKLEPNSLDAALFYLSYHDLYWRPKEASVPFGNPAQVTADLFAALRPGGVVVVVDHVAEPGGDTAQIVETLHRIDPQVVKRDFTQAGFLFDGESAVFRSTDDDHGKPVFDAAIRYRTDRFMYRFRKPPQ